MNTQLQIYKELFSRIYNFVNSISDKQTNYNKTTNDYDQCTIIHDLIKYHRNSDLHINDFVLYVALEAYDAIYNSPTASRKIAENFDLPSGGLPQEFNTNIRDELLHEITHDIDSDVNIQKQIVNPVSYVNYNVKSFLNQSDLISLFRLLNPQLKQKKAYITLDSKYATYSESNTKLRWELIEGLTETDTSFNVVGGLKNVISIKIYSVLITPQFTSSMKRGTILIDEFAAQSFVAPNGRRYHMMGLLNDPALPISIGARSTVAIDYGYTPDISVRNKYEILAGFRFNEGVYNFNQPITTFNSLTLSFGNPFNLINMRKHIIPNCYFETIHYQALSGDILDDDYYGNFDLVCPEPHFITNTIYSLKIIGFTTDDPVTDAEWITYMNNNEFTKAIALDSTRIRIYPRQICPPGVHPTRIEYNSSTWADSYVGNGSIFSIQFDTVRSIVNIEFTYLDE